MLEPRAGRVALLVAFGWTLAVSAAVYLGIERVPTVVIPIVVTALPFPAVTTRQGVHLRLVSLILLVIWVVLGSASVGLFYLPAAGAMALAHNAAQKASTPQGTGIDLLHGEVHK